MLNFIVDHMLRIVARPLLWIGNRRVKRNNDVRAQRRRGLQPKPQFLKPRKRTLTLPMSAGGRTRLRTDSQSECVLLWRLPVELRRQIWEYHLGGIVFHMSVVKRKLASFTCTSPDECSNLRRHSCSRSYAIKRFQECDNRNLLALLLTCRQVYV